MSTRPLRITILNSVALNAGDAAILHGELAALRDAFPDAQIEVADDDPAPAGRYYPGVRFVPGFLSRRSHEPSGGARSLHRRRRAAAVALLERAPRAARLLLDREERLHLDRLRRSDAVVSTGGTYLVERYSGDARARARAIAAAQALGRPTWLYTQSLGPFTQPALRRLVARVAARSAGVFLRDERSRRHLVDIGVDPSRLAVVPDAAFALAPATPPVRHSFERRRIGISVREWREFPARGRATGRAAYRAAVAATARLLAREGAEVVFLSTCQGAPEYWTDDARFATELVREHLGGVPGIVVDGAFHTPPQLIQRYRDFDLVIATRMHAAILALCAVTPVVPIAYEFKTTELFRDLGMQELADDIQSVTSESLTARVRSALANADGVRSRITRLLPNLRTRASAPARAIRDYLAGPP